MKPRIAIVHYSSTGTVYQLAVALAEGAFDAGAEVRLRRVRETVPDDLVAKNPAWVAHRAATAEVPEATLDDLAWADGIALGSPSRFGGPAVQLRAFVEATTPLWARGELADKATTAFTSADNPHGGQEGVLFALHTVFCHWGSVIVPPGYTDPCIFAAGGNPYGSSAQGTKGAPLAPAIEAAARYQGRRLADFAAVLAGFRATRSRAA